jgi:glycosyltransferase involved in cell wall biosynthesis
MSPRAVFVSNLFPSSTEPGRGQYNLDQLRALRDAGLDFDVISPRPWFPGLSRRSTGGAPYPPAVEDVDGFRVAHPRALYLPLSRGSINATLFGWSIAASCQAAAQRFRPDFLWASFAFPDGVGMSRVARGLGMPFVVSVLGSDVNVSFGMPGRRLAMLSAFADARLIFAKSAHLRARLVEAGVDAARVVVDYNGTATAVFRPQLQVCACRELGLDVRRRLLFVGNLVPVKGLTDLMLAWKEVSDAVPAGTHELVLVGHGPLADSLRRMARTLCLEHSVRFVGPEPRARVAGWIGASTALVLPSLDEGVPNVILEALASGRPVVATRVGGVPEIHPGDSAGALVPVRDQRSLARAIRVVLRGSWDPERLRAIVADRTWPVNARRVLDALAGALGRSEETPPGGFCR